MLFTRSAVLQHIKMTYWILTILLFKQMVIQIYPTERQLNKANPSDTEAPSLNLDLSMTDDLVSFKIYDKRDDFNFLK